MNAIQTIESPPKYVPIPAYLRIDQAATYCSCSAEYLSKETRKGDIAHIKKGRCVFYAVVDLDEWMRRDRIEMVA